MTEDEPLFKAIARLRGWLYENPEATRDLDRLVASLDDEPGEGGDDEAEKLAGWIEFYTDACELVWDPQMVARFRRAVELLRGEDG